MDWFVGICQHKTCLATRSNFFMAGRKLACWTGAGRLNTQGWPVRRAPKLPWAGTERFSRPFPCAGQAPPSECRTAKCRTDIRTHDSYHLEHNKKGPIAKMRPSLFVK